MSKKSAESRNIVSFSPSVAWKTVVNTPLYPLSKYIRRGGGREPSELSSRNNFNLRKEKNYLSPSCQRPKSTAIEAFIHQILKG